MFAAYGMPLYAVADGVINRVWNNRLGGLSVNLIDGDGHRYYYAHLDAQHARQGQRVSAGAVIGTVGNTGNARTTPPHLHLGRRYAGAWVEARPAFAGQV
jgi:murein DD-endopeptidase MepM/ murein hydrolase activator NlpD